MDYTREQLSAINTRDRSLLVSAAAGAGKTATLTKRIISAILDPENPEDIANMLIVTFTKAAVGELKERIGRAIEDALSKDPENRSLMRQLTLLPTANISTIDAFCNSVLKKNGDKVGAPTNYRIADSAEFELLSGSVFSGLINALYENELPEVASAEEFIRLAEALTSSKRNADLEEVLLNLYNKSKSVPEGVEIFTRLADEYKAEDPLKSKYALYATEHVHKIAEHYSGELTRISSQLSVGNADEVKYAAIFNEDLEYLRTLSSAESYREIKDALDVEGVFKRLPSRAEKSDAVLFGIELRGELKEHLKRVRENFFFYSEEEWRELFPAMHKVLSLLARVLVAFDGAYSAEKRRRGILEYSDIERYAYLALYENGAPSDAALAIREEFTSIYIDEYQDVNALQGMIFDAISKPDNRFMVGDIKQSIYGFRSADPDIFASMKKSFPPLEESTPGGAASIFMSQNFRCDKGIIDFVNRVFDKIFGASAESIGYTSHDRLGFAKVYDGIPVPEERPTELMLIPGLKRSYASDEDEDDEEGGSEKIRAAECEAVAQKIREILDTGTLDNGKRPTPKDIAIIVRRGKKRLADYAAALERHGIPSRKAEDKEFFLNSEVLLALALLNTVDNPKRDIYLAGLLLSPIYKFTPDELYFIRLAGGGTLYDSLVLYTDSHPEWEKGHRFLSELSRYRLLSEGIPTDALILRLYKDTGLIELAENRGAKEHLLLLYDYAKRFASSGYHGLYNFIRFINNVIDGGAKLEAAARGGEGDAVNIITVHASKGLEYPIVFYADTDAIFYDGDAKNRIAYSEKFGMSLCLRAEEAAALVENPVQKIIRHYAKRSYIEEEFRISYVALTRAREQLYVVGCVPEDAEDYLKKMSFKGETLSSFSVYDFKSALELMLATARTFARVSIIEPKEKEGENAAEEPQNVQKNIEFDDTGIDAELLSSRFGFNYPDAHLSRIPEKLSVSRLYPTVLDGAESEKDELLIEEAGTAPSEKPALPEFYTGSASDESAKRGTATHLFMQFFDPDSLITLGARGELQRLTERGFISEDDSERVRINEIESFAKSDFFREMREASALHREFRFNTRIAARHLTRDAVLLSALRDEEILVQGVIDCVFCDGHGEYHLVDYKTDRLTKEELADKSLAKATLSEKHALQLNYYALAVEKIFGKAPKSIRIYSLPLGSTVDIDRVLD